MVDDVMFEKLIKKTLSSGGEYADVFVEHKMTTAIQLEDERVEKVTTGSQSGIGIRLICNGKTAYVYSNDFSADVLLNLAHTASLAASSSPQDLTLNMQRRYPEATSSLKIPPDTVPMSSKVALVNGADRVARKVDARIKQVKVVYKDYVQKVSIASSDGFVAEDRRVHSMGFVQVIAVEGGTMQTGYEPIGGLIGFELFDDLHLEQCALKAAKRAVMMLKAKRISGGRMPVIISSEAGGTMIHEAIGHGLEADLAQQGLSIYSKKIGQRVASPMITVIDDATIPNNRGSFCFDDEGTPSGRNVLVREGILQGYMYDKYTAMNDHTVSTGNGRRESYGHKPMPRMTNTFIAPGNLLPDDVIRSVANGLFVNRMGGGQVNTITGDFVFDVQEGYLVENGLLGDAVRGATLIGNGFEVLRSIDMVASDLGFSIGTCGKDSQGVPVSDGMPTLRIPEMVVGGQTR